MLSNSSQAKLVGMGSFGGEGGVMRSLLPEYGVK
jgi:hypothetical protein